MNDEQENEEWRLWEAQLRANLEAHFSTMDFCPGDALPYDEVLELLVLVAGGLRSEMLRLNTISDRIRFAIRSISLN